MRSAVPENMFSSASRTLAIRVLTFVIGYEIGGFEAVWRPNAASNDGITGTRHQPVAFVVWLIVVVGVEW